MRNLFFSIVALTCFATASFAQSIACSDKLFSDAFQLALWTIDNNTDGNLLKAGANYGGEWTRDISMNSWNAVSELRPDVAEYSLWSVTNNRETIGHQYWDKIIWVTAAWNHYLVTGREDFLTEAYQCAKATITQLEDSIGTSNEFGLFNGAAVFQDGIAAYDEPVYSPALDDKSYVLDHPNSHQIKCLSTNAIYYNAYVALAEMARLREPAAVKGYLQKAKTLRKNFRKHLFNSKENRLYYLIDHNGKKHEYQEALGVAYAIIFGLITKKEAQRVIDNAFVTPNGIPCVWPCFPRFSAEKPGRHNVMIWPQCNMYFASACAMSDKRDAFWKEMHSLANLAINRYEDNADSKAALGKPAGNFHEIYKTDGAPSGGWQCGNEWPALNHQTWCATGFIRNVLYSVCGMQPTVKGLCFAPIGMEDGREVTLRDISYRNAKLNITVKGNGATIRSCTVNGKPAKPFIPANAAGKYDIVITL